MSGGKGGSQTQTTGTALPPELQAAMNRNIAQAEEISKIGYVPYYGPEVAALTPMQEAAMQSTGLAAQAFGLPNALGKQVTPEPEEFAGGVRGYSSGSLYDAAVEELKTRRPGQYDAIMNQFIDPFTWRPRAGEAAQPDMQEIFRQLGYVETPLGPIERMYRTVNQQYGTIYDVPQTFTNDYGQEVYYISPFEAAQRKADRGQ